MREEGIFFVGFNLPVVKITVMRFTEEFRGKTKMRLRNSRKRSGV